MSLASSGLPGRRRTCDPDVAGGGAAFPARVQQCNGAAGLLTFALVLITVTPAVRPR